MRANAGEFVESDLAWIEPIARRFDEWQGAEALAKNCFKAWVIRPFCVAVLYEDENGMVLCGVTDDGEAMKHFIRLVRVIAQVADHAKMTLIGYWEPSESNWRARVAEQIGFRYDYEKNFYVRNPAQQQAEPRMEN